MLVTYYYRVLIEMVIDHKDLWETALESLIHYNNLAVKKGMMPAKEGLLYDLGEVLFHVASNRSEDRALFIYKNYFKSVWESGIKEGNHMRNVTERAIVKAYWSFLFKKWYKLTSSLKEGFLENEQIHFDTLTYLYKVKQKLHWEFNDRLLRFPCLAKKAREISKEFYNRHVEKSKKEA